MRHLVITLALFVATAGVASAHVTVSRTGATLVLAAVSDRVMEALRVTKLTRVLQVEHDEAAAVARLQHSQSL